MTTTTSTQTQTANRATSIEGIQEQHQKAAALLFSMPCDERVDHGAIPLEHKTHLSPENPCWSSRGQVDVSPLRTLVEEGYDCDYRESTPEEPYSPSNLWHPNNAAQNNVSIRRPSHDGWGIGKIVLIFADDFLQNCFQFPWWHLRADLRAAVEPVLQALQIAPTQVVRLLLASLPPSTTIPLHQDSGEWVYSTHRVHVPVIVPNPDQILFRCGFSTGTDDLCRVDCVPGHVFEINNAQTHAVTNASSFDYRVHMILDYCENPATFSKLQPSEVLYQTRRSLNRQCERDSRPTPSFFILGAQKAGTTSLYHYINQHALVFEAKRRETHCFDWRWNPKLKTVAKQREWVQKFYPNLSPYPSCLTGDSTPSYLLDSRRVIPRLKAVVTWPISLFVMVREPIRRAESHYAMVTSPHGTAAQLQTRGKEWRSLSFWEVVQKDLENMKACGLLPHWNIQTGTCDLSIWNEFAGGAEENKAWQRYLQLHVPLNTGSYGLLARGMYELQLRPWMVEYADSVLLLVLERDMQGEEALEHTMEKVWLHLGLPFQRLMDTSARNTREYSSFLAPQAEEKKEDDGDAHPVSHDPPEKEKQQQKEYLQRFFTPYNERLLKLMEKRGWGDHGWTYV